MVEFKVNSIHYLKARIALPSDNINDEEDHVILFWLVDLDGKKHDIMQGGLTLGGDEYFPLYHLTKTEQDFSFTMKMPDKPGDYILRANVDTKEFNSKPGIIVRIVK